MFDFLKKKISGFIDTITGKQAVDGKRGMPGKKADAPEPKLEERKAEAQVAKKSEEKNDAQIQPAEARKEAAAPKGPANVKKEAPEAKKEGIAQAPHAPVMRKEEISKPLPEKGESKTRLEEPVAPEERIAKKPAEMKGEAGEKAHAPGKKINLSIMSQVKSVFSSEVQLSEADVGGVLDSFELGLLESDVAFEVAEQIKQDLKTKLVGRKVSKPRLKEEITRIFSDSIKAIMAENKGSGVVERVRNASAKPVKIMFTGPNGSGKTTTIAKIAKMLVKEGYGVVIAAADTFRAAAIEQMEIHGARLGVKVIAGRYGADPTSIAYDAVNYAKAHRLDVVLIDTAGRQETNQNLLNELKKMVRVISPEIKIYVGESIAGNAIIEQVGAFQRELGLDGVILTKLDCDAKGGTVISISKVTKVPVLYVTTGQGYEDIEAFDEEKIARNIAG